jgi:hypothetical protein
MGCKIECIDNYFKVEIVLVENKYKTKCVLDNVFLSIILIQNNKKE